MKKKAELVPLVAEYEMFNADCIPKMYELAAKGRQFDLSIFSPPFSSLYAYSSHVGDMGNSRESDDEFSLHYRFFAEALFPLIKSGRNVCMHIAQITRQKGVHGYMGLHDLRGDMIRLMTDAGFIYYGETTIWKNPQSQSIRLKAHALMFTQLEKNSLVSRPALADYLLIFKKPGEAERGVVPEVSRDSWIDWASPIWLDIRETNTLNTKAARDEKDERHVCPLQLDFIERCVLLWSNQGEEVFSPFAGIGSEGYVSLLKSRRFTGIELNEGYYTEAKNNLDLAIQERKAKEDQICLSI